MSIFESLGRMTKQIVNLAANKQKGGKEMFISEITFNRRYPKAIPGIYQEISKQIKNAGCVTKEQQAMFLAQCAIESNGFSTLEENLNYRAEVLLKVFPKYFTPVTARQYGRIVDPKTKKTLKPADPKMIANIAYGNRMKNGPVSSGDGYRFRGRGIIQITGRENYERLSKDLKNPKILTNPEILATDIELAVKAAVWFWVQRRIANKGSDVKGATYLVNGGYNHLAERTDEFNQLIA